VTQDHYHITCLQCGKIEDAPIETSDNALENLENALGRLTKHGIFGHKLEFVGLCKECLQKESETPNTTSTIVENREGGVPWKSAKE
jgi:Fe2+ or Zn2+ uptake regulation protein